MAFCLLIGLMGTVNLFYFDLVFFVFYLCSYIPIWVVFMLLWNSLSRHNYGAFNGEENVFELVWTLVPSSLVACLCLLNLQCGSTDTFPYGLVNVGIIGRQWFWSYNVLEEDGIYDSLMLDFIDSVGKPLRLLFHERYRLVVTSSDVVHSFAVPWFGVKVDAIPGRLNQVYFRPSSVGVFVGYCSELCGAGHSYMPIIVEVVKKFS